MTHSETKDLQVGDRIWIEHIDDDDEYGGECVSVGDIVKVTHIDSDCYVYIGEARNYLTESTRFRRILRAGEKIAAGTKYQGVNNSGALGDVCSQDNSSGSTVRVGYAHFVLANHNPLLARIEQLEAELATLRKQAETSTQ